MILTLLALIACAPADLAPIPGTTFRVEEPTTKGKDNDIKVHMFQNEESCRGGEVAEKDVALCVPYVDRGTGQVRVAFQLRVDGKIWPYTLSRDNLKVLHSKHPRDDFMLVPHDEVPTNQLFILLLDATYSMQYIDADTTYTRLEKVRRALLQPDVIKAFYPGGSVKTAVVPLMLRGGTATPIALAPKLVAETPAEYKAAIENGLTNPTGYTPLYAAITQVLDTTLTTREVTDRLETLQLQPTIIALTDGFNNTSRDDTCATNVQPLNNLLAHLRDLRSTKEARFRPTLFAVGLGRPAWGGQVKRPDNLTITTGDLCTRRADSRIDGGLELYGVDNRALSYLAWDGGGASFVSPSQKGLADAFRDAASHRYRWFEIRYRQDPFHLRRAWESEVVLSTVGDPRATMRFVPNAWMDAPPGELQPDGWTIAAPLAKTLGVILPILGAIISFSYVPAAWFNAKRAIFGLIPRSRRRK